MDELTYTSRDVTLSLINDKFTVQTANEARSYQWEYGLGRKNIYSPRRRTTTIDLRFSGERAELEKLRRYADRDISEETPGLFTAQGEWVQKGYIYGIKVEKVTPYEIYGTLKIILLEGAWYKTVVNSYTKNSANSSTAFGMDYPYDFLHDYGYADTVQLLDTGSYTRCDFKLTIFGDCINPVITIGKNEYRVNVTVAEGSLLIIDTREKTVTLRDNTGYEENVFNMAERGEGAGQGRYIFEPLAPGENPVVWDNSYGFDIEYYVAESEPPWVENF